MSARIEHMFVQESAKRRCSFPGCGRPHLAKGLCRGHYEQHRSKRSLQPLPPRRRGDPACSFVGCGNVAVNRGLCQAHANQRRKGQSLRPLRPFYGTQGPCRFDGCSKPRAAGGFCAGHAAQYYGGRPLAPLFKPKVGCDFPGCTKRHFALGHCQGHWRQLREKRTLAPLREKKGWYEIGVTSTSWNPCIPTRREMAMLLSTQKSWPQDSADLWSPSRKSTIRTGSAATTGQRTSNSGPEACNHLGVASAT